MRLDDRTIRANLQRDLLNGIGGALFLGGVYANGAVVIRRMGADATTVAYLTAIPFLANVAVLLLLPIIPRGNPVLLLVVASAATRLASLPAGWATSPAMLLAAWTLMSLCLALSALPTLDVVSAMYPANRRAHLVGRVRTVSIGAALVAGPLMGSLLDRFGAGITFTLIGLTSAACGIALLKVHAPQQQKSPRISIVNALGTLRYDVTFRGFVLAWTMWGVGVLLPLAVYPLLLVDRFHASYTAIGLLSALTGGSALLTYRWWARQADHRDPRLLAAIGFSLATAVPVVYALAPSLPVLGLASVLAGVSQGAIEMSNMQAMLRFAPRGDAIRYTSVFNAAAGLRGAIAPVAGSLLVTSYGATPVLLTGAAIGLVSAGGMWRSSRRSLPAPHLDDPA